MLGVVNLHRASIDEGLQGVVAVSQSRQSKGLWGGAFEEGAGAAAFSACKFPKAARAAPTPKVLSICRRLKSWGEFMQKS